MNYTLSLLILTFTSLSSIAQKNDTSIYTPPSLKEGDFSFHNYLNKNINYPKFNLASGIEAKLKVTFQVKSSSKIENIIVTGHNKEFFEKSIESLITKTSGKWKPGMVNQQPVDTAIYKEIYYSLETSQNYLGDTNVVEILLYKSPLNSQKSQEDLFKKQVSVSYSKRYGYSEYTQGIDSLTASNFPKAIQLFMLAEQKGFNPIDLYYNRGLAFYNAGRKSLGCRDWEIALKAGDKEVGKMLIQYCEQ